MRSAALSTIAVLACLARPGLASPSSPTRIAAQEIVALWRGTTTKPTAHIGSAAVRWESHCTHESADAVFAVTQRDPGELQKKLDDVFVGEVTECDVTACCHLAKGKRTDRGFVDALCFDKDAHLARVREINDGACHG